MAARWRLWFSAVSAVLDLKVEIAAKSQSSNMQRADLCYLFILISSWRGWRDWKNLKHLAYQADSQIPQGRRNLK